MNPTRVNEMSNATEYIYETPLVTVSAVRAIRGDRYDDTYRVILLVKGDDGLTEEQVEDLVRALRLVES